MNWHSLALFVATVVIIHFIVKNRQAHQRHLDFMAHIKSLSRVHDALVDDTNARLDAAHTDDEADALIEGFRTVSKAITNEMSEKSMEDTKDE